MFRPMNRPKQAMDPAECTELLSSQRRGVLSVLGDDGYPYGIPMNHYYCPEDGKIYFHSGKNGHKIDALRRCEKASYCVIDQGVSADRGWALDFRSVVVFGRVELTEDRGAVCEMTRRLSRLFTDDEDYIAGEIARFGPATLLLVLTPEHISGKRVNES